MIQEKIKDRSHRSLLAALAVVLVSMIPGIFLASLKPLAYIVSLVYIGHERRKGGASWEELGFKLRDFKKDFSSTWYLFLIVLLLQLPIPLLAIKYWPELANHILDRLSFIHTSSFGMIVLILVAIPLVEEMIFRGLLQKRLALYLGPAFAILIASLIFSLQHLTFGQPALVAIDLAGIALDGILYGWIFFKSQNVLLSWLAHVAADFFGLALLILLFK